MDRRNVRTQGKTKMRTVKLTIEVKIPNENAAFLTVDENGAPVVHMYEPSRGFYESKFGQIGIHMSCVTKRLTVKNWRNLKINLKEYFESQD